jgi:hypothetical protein
MNTLQVRLLSTDSDLSYSLQSPNYHINLFITTPTTRIAGDFIVSKAPFFRRKKLPNKKWEVFDRTPKGESFLIS